MKYCVDLNSDLGESFGSYTIGQDELVMDYITSANIACGYHAGDHNVIHKTIKTAIHKKVGLGAHPGFDDLIGFGRREMKVDPEDIYNSVIYQVGAVRTFASIYNQTLNHVKPHGALFNMASRDHELAQAIAEAVYRVDPKLILFGLSGGALIKAGQKVGLTVAEEVFADRTYQPDGSLTSRSERNAMIHDPEEAIHRVVRMIKEGKIEAIDGSDISIKADTICVHGDEPNTLAFVKKLRQGLIENGIAIKTVGAS